MKLVYNGYEFQDNSVQFTWTKSAILGPTGRRSHYAVKAIVTGVMQAASVSSLTTALGGLESQMKSSNGDLIFYDNDGAVTVHQIKGSDTINGIRVGPIRYPDGLPGVWGARTEYVNRKTYQVVFEAEIPDPESNLVAYTETISQLSSGLHDFTTQQAIAGIPQQVITAQITPQKYRQRGRAIGFDSYPTYPLFAYPALYLKKEPFVAEQDWPIHPGVNLFTHYPIRWSFDFEIPTGTILLPPANPTL